MCDYVNTNKCTITGDCCPYIYWCDKINNWRELKSKPKVCQIEARVPKSAPNGYCRVLFSKHGNLYVDRGDEAVIVKNTLDHTPEFVMLKRVGDKWEISL